MNPPIPEHDPVEHPKHYCSHPSGIECIEVTRHMNFNCGNVIKYLWRCGLKDSAPSIEDLRKAAWYLNDEIRRVQGDAPGLPSARLSREELDNIGANLKKARRPAVMVDGQPTYEIPLNPNDDLAEYLAARQRMRDAMTPEEKELRKEVREASTLPPMDTSVEEAKKLIWGELFARALPHEKGPIPPRMVDVPSRPILVADEQAPVNLDALADHIDQVVNEFPTEPLDPHA